LKADEHLDSKAGRILAAIAFLTAAATGLFGRLYNHNQKEVERSLDFVTDKFKHIVSYIYYPEIWKIDASPFFFTLYVVFVLLGTVLYLYALGPSLNISSWFERRKGDEVQSLLFFYKIAAVKLKDWQDKWDKIECNKNKLSKLRQEMLINFKVESYLIAQKTKAKHDLMSVGNFFFRVALIFFVLTSINLLKFVSEEKLLPPYLALFFI